MTDFDLLVRGEQDIGISEGKIVALGNDLPGSTKLEVDAREALGDCGVVGLKAFMCNSGIGDFPFVDEATLSAGMKRASALGLLVAVHAESEEMTSALTGAARAAGKKEVRDFLESRPVA